MNTTAEFQEEIRAQSLRIARTLFQFQLDLIEDAATEGYLAAMEALETHPEEAQKGTYLRRVMRNRIIDFRNRWNYRTRLHALLTLVSLDSPATDAECRELPLCEVIPSPVSLESYVADRDAAAYFCRKVARLHPRDVPIVMLRAEGLQLPEIAEQLGLTQHTVKCRLYGLQANMRSLFPRYVEGLA